MIISDGTIRQSKNDSLSIKQIMHYATDKKLLEEALRNAISLEGSNSFSLATHSVSVNNTQDMEELEEPNAKGVSVPHIKP